MLKKICRCGKLIDQREQLCKSCSLKHKEEVKKRNRVYNSYNRDKDIDTFYKTDEWESTRAYILSKYKYLDLWDYFINNKITTANTVHHIEEIKEAYELRLEESNLFSIGPKNHAKIHKLYRADKENTQNKLKEILKMAESTLIV